MPVKDVCPVCSSKDLLVFLEILDVPVHVGLQWSSQYEARHCPKGDIKLAFCNDCSFIANIAFEPTYLGYTQAYENSLDFSKYYQDYTKSLASRLIKRYKLYNKNIIEIGCGKGSFLTLLCGLGNNRGVGFDPSYECKLTDDEVAKQVTFIQDFYSERYGTYQADFICCRYVFEHIHNPINFLIMLRCTIGNHLNTALYFEVPNVLFVLRDLSIFDIIYEHYSYFSLESLARVFDLCGFFVCDLTETYDGQFLSIEAFPGKVIVNSSSEQRDKIKSMTHYVEAFANNYQNKLEMWRRNIYQIEHKEQKIVIWGAGTKGVSFLNKLNIYDQIEYVVDINPNKQGKYIAGTGQLIVSPEFLRDYQPHVVIIMNSIYKDEIHQTIKEVGLVTDFLYV